PRTPGRRCGVRAPRRGALYWRGQRRTMRSVMRRTRGDWGCWVVVMTNALYQTAAHARLLDTFRRGLYGRAAPRRPDGWRAGRNAHRVAIAEGRRTAWEACGWQSLALATAPRRSCKACATTATR